MVVQSTRIVFMMFRAAMPALALTAASSMTVGGMRGVPIRALTIIVHDST
jgi:hypothetical protein